MLAVSHTKPSPSQQQLWKVEFVEAGEAAGGEVAGVETTPTVSTEVAGEEAITAAEANETSAGAVAAEEAPTRTSLHGWDRLTKLHHKFQKVVLFLPLNQKPQSKTILNV